MKRSRVESSHPSPHHRRFRSSSAPCRRPHPLLHHFRSAHPFPFGNFDPHGKWAPWEGKGCGFPRPSDSSVLNDARVAALLALPSAAAFLGPGARVLDVGCGGGYFSAALLAAFPSISSYLGVDIDAGLIARARRVTEWAAMRSTSASASGESRLAAALRAAGLDPARVPSSIAQCQAPSRSLRAAAAGPHTKCQFRTEDFLSAACTTFFPPVIAPEPRAASSAAAASPRQQQQPPSLGAPGFAEGWGFTDLDPLPLPRGSLASSSSSSFSSSSSSSSSSSQSLGMLLSHAVSTGARTATELQQRRVEGGATALAADFSTEMAEGGPQAQAPPPPPPPPPPHLALAASSPSRPSLPLALPLPLAIAAPLPLSKSLSAGNLYLHYSESSFSLSREAAAAALFPPPKASAHTSSSSSSSSFHALLPSSPRALAPSYLKPAQHLSCPSPMPSPYGTTSSFLGGGSSSSSSSGFLLPHPPASYTVIFCLKLTKWVHFTKGDRGVLLLFRRLHQLLAPGGVLVLEANSWDSYWRSARQLGGDFHAATATAVAAAREASAASAAAAVRGAAKRHRPSRSHHHAPSSELEDGRLYASSSGGGGGGGGGSSGGGSGSASSSSSSSSSSRDPYAAAAAAAAGAAVAAAAAAGTAPTTLPYFFYSPTGMLLDSLNFRPDAFLHHLMRRCGFSSLESTLWVGGAAAAQAHKAMQDEGEHGGGVPSSSSSSSSASSSSASSAAAASAVYSGLDGGGSGGRHPVNSLSEALLLKRPRALYILRK